VNPPDPSNDYQQAHAELIAGSYRRIIGLDLLEPGPDLARRLFEAPIFVASHDTADDPVLTYGNQTALSLFEMNWKTFTSTPSRFTAEEPQRDERERLLEAVRTKGFIDDYSGIRISSSGKRFEIQRATVWNLLDGQGRAIGQAATFSSWIEL
jgi:hypothetical protein